MAATLEAYLNGRTAKGSSPSWEAIEQEIQKQLDYRTHHSSDDYCFLILDFKPSQNGVQYVQMSCNPGKEEFIVETRLDYGAEDFRHYHLDTTEPKAAFEAFREVFEGKAPNLDGWLDWTEYLR